LLAHTGESEALATELSRSGTPGTPGPQSGVEVPVGVAVGVLVPVVVGVFVAVGVGVWVAVDIAAPDVAVGVDVLVTVAVGVPVTVAPGFNIIGMYAASEMMNEALPLVAAAWP
jgi:hypothetical protein